MTNWKELSRKWKVDVRHGGYHVNGYWYHRMKAFPCALFDPSGYVRFETKEQYENCPELRIGVRIWVPKGIYNMPRYIKVVD